MRFGIFSPCLVSPIFTVGPLVLSYYEGSGHCKSASAGPSSKGPNALRRMTIFTASREARISAAIHRRGLRTFGVDGVPLPAARATLACR
jgi:hypothetical protein